MVPLPTLLDLPAPIDGARRPWYPTPERSLSRFALFPPNTSRRRRTRRAHARTRVRHHAPPPPAALRWSPRANNRPSPARAATTPRDDRQASAERNQPTRAGIEVARTAIEVAGTGTEVAGRPPDARTACHLPRQTRGRSGPLPRRTMRSTRSAHLRSPPVGPSRRGASARQPNGPRR